MIKPSLTTTCAREKIAQTLTRRTLEEIAHKTLKGDYDPSSARVAADILKWTAGRKKPKKYGDKQAIEHTFTETHPFKGLDLDVQKKNNTQSKIAVLEKRVRIVQGGTSASKTFSIIPLLDYLRNTKA